MGLTCLVCNHNFGNSNCKFFKPPQDKNKLKKWQKQLKLSDNIVSRKSSRICCCHFPNYNKENIPLDPKKYHYKKIRLSALSKALNDRSTNIDSLCNTNAVITDTLDISMDDSTSITTEMKTDSLDMSIAGSISSTIAMQTDTNRNKEETVQTQLSCYDLLYIDSLVYSDSAAQTDSHSWVKNASAQTDYKMQGVQTRTLNQLDATSSIYSIHCSDSYMQTDNKVKASIGVQTVESMVGNVPFNVLHNENRIQKEKLLKLQEKITNMNLRFEFRFIENSDARVYRYTGLATKNVFDIVYRVLSAIPFQYNQNWNVFIVPKKEQLLITLMKLRLNLRHFDLAQRFGCSEATVTNIVRTWILALHEVSFIQLMNKIPSRKKNKTSLPNIFACFDDCRVTLDCSEFNTDKPKNILRQRETFSNYKKRNTFKPLIGCAPNAVGTFCSDLYPGCYSDKVIVEHCGVLKSLCPGDVILADKGFLIDDIVPYAVKVNLPPFLTTTQFTKQQSTATTQIARARVHIERLIRRIKCFHILDYIPCEMFNIANEVFQVVKHVRIPSIRCCLDVF